MSDTPDIPGLPEPPPEPQSGSESGPKIGVDSWVASHGDRSGRSGPIGSVTRAWESIPDVARFLAFFAIALSLPFWLLKSEGDLFNFGLFTLIFIGMGLGLNVDVGFAGLLDLGYVAAFGIGGYAYALLSSGYYGIHWPAEAVIPIAMLAAVVPAAILGFSSRRLLGDYLAIVTLFFAEAFLVFTNVSNPTIFGKGITGGANGIPQADPLTFFGYQLTSSKQLYFFLVGAVARGRRGSLSRQPVTDGARVAGVAGGPARRRGDEHPRQPAQDPCLHLQLGSGRPVRRDLRRRSSRPPCRRTTASGC